MERPIQCLGGKTLKSEWKTNLVFVRVTQKYDKLSWVNE